MPGEPQLRMMYIKAYLNTPFPRPKRNRKNLLWVILVGVAYSLFILLYQPFGIENPTGEWGINLIILSLAGIISGTLFLGIGGRLMMIAMAIIGGLTGGFSWGGSLEVVILGALIGLCSGAFMGINYPFSFKNKVLWGLLHGLLAYLMILILPIDGKGAPQGFPDLQMTVHILFGGLFLLYGIGMAFLFHSLQSKWHKRLEF